MLADATPVLLIHGYSACGTTFAHRALQPGLAQHLCERGHNVWVLDMRSSCRAPSARHRWEFEDLAFCDIPAAIAHIKEQSNCTRIDIVAHCMGAVMLSMAILNQESGRGALNSQCDVSRSIRQLVLSQAGPYLQFSPANRFRAYVVNRLRHALPLQDYSFNPEPSPSQDLIDRVLSALPYQTPEPYEMENPWFGQPGYSRVRRRMDALYGQAFNLPNIGNDVLDNIDEFFGPLNVRTIEQTIRFAQRGQISDQFGQGFKQTIANLNDKWTFPTLWVHGADNGLVDPMSPVMTANVFEQAGIGRLFDAQVFPGLGHQDAIMGHCNEMVLDAIAAHVAGG